MQNLRIGPYRVERRLGSGGMGEVFQAWDERLQRWVAIKSFHPTVNDLPERRARLLREARALAGLSHPAVAQIYDVVIEEGREHLVMELVRGRSLAALMIDGPLEVEQVLRLAGQLAEGLGAAHARGVVHRDLKAENVMITPEGHAKILDFGLVKRFDSDSGEESLTGDGVVMGTTRAMSPEQAEGRDLDHRSDLFSLGSLLYEMLTGRHPFQASSPLETMQRMVSHRPPSVGRVRAGLPVELVRLVDGLLEKDPDRRPAAAGGVLATLERIRVAAASPAPRRRSGRTRAIRLTLLVALLAGLTLVLVAVLG